MGRASKTVGGSSNSGSSDTIAPRAGDKGSDKTVENGYKESLSDTKPAAGTDTKPAAGTDTKPAVGTDTKPAAGTDTKPAAGTDGVDAQKPAKTSPDDVGGGGMSTGNKMLLGGAALGGAGLLGFGATRLMSGGSNAQPTSPSIPIAGGTGVPGPAGGATGMPGLAGGATGMPGLAGGATEMSGTLGSSVSIIPSFLSESSSAGSLPQPAGGISTIPSGSISGMGNIGNR